MNTDSKLHYLIDLLDDDSVEVRDEIMKQLNIYGLSLEKDLRNLPEEITLEKLNLITPILETNKRKWLEKNWNNWFDLENVNEKIECALDLISRFHYGIYAKPELSELLDQLAEEFKNKIPYGDELDLANFLFQEKQIKGAADNYYNPFNNNLIYAIKEKKGLPITLSLIYILIGYRLGFGILGCNFPGHFLAKVILDDETILIDCFNGGKIIYEQDIKQIMKTPVESIAEIIRNNVSPATILTRVLNNLINSYSSIGDTVNAELFTKLLKQTPK